MSIGLDFDVKDFEDEDSSTTSEEGQDESAESSTAKKTIPYDRFKKEVDKRKELERRLADVTTAGSRKELNDDVAKMKEEGALGTGFKIPPNTPFDEAMEMVVKEAEKRALSRIESKQSQADAEVKRYEKLIDDGFDSLRDEGHNITKKEESEMLDMIQTYRISIENTEDFTKVYDLYKKSQGQGKQQKNTFSFTNSQRNPAPKTTKTDYNKPLSKVVDDIRSELGIR